MRHTRIGLLSALVAGFAATAYAQATLPTPTEPRDVAAAGFNGRPFGSVDVGGRFTSIDGDPARYQRYRDLRDGPFARTVSLRRRTEDSTLEAYAENIGYRDQRYFAEYRDV